MVPGSKLFDVVRRYVSASVPNSKWSRIWPSRCSLTTKPPVCLHLSAVRPVWLKAASKPMARCFLVCSCPFQLAISVRSDSQSCGETRQSFGLYEIAACCKVSAVTAITERCAVAVAQSPTLARGTCSRRTHAAGCSPPPQYGRSDRYRSYEESAMITEDRHETGEIRQA